MTPWTGPREKVPSNIHTWRNNGRYYERRRRPLVSPGRFNWIAGVSRRPRHLRRDRLPRKPRKDENSGNIPGKTAQRKGKTGRHPCSPSTIPHLRRLSMIEPGDESPPGIRPSDSSSRTPCGRRNTPDPRGSVLPVITEIFSCLIRTGFPHAAFSVSFLSSPLHGLLHAPQTILRSRMNCSKRSFWK
jgi:hypothetical protein